MKSLPPLYKCPSSFRSNIFSFPSLLNRSTGDGGMCAINRSSIYILLGIQIHLCDLTRGLFTTIVSGNKSTRSAQNMKLMFRALSMGVPLLLLSVAYVVESDDVESENYELNVARHFPDI